MGSVSIFAGGYGSGKTEIALNFAIQAAAGTEEVVLADLDLVNPYFVSRDRRESLAARQIELLAPEGVLSFGDVPQLPPRLITALHRDNHLFIDVAGDDAGALVMGYLHPYLAERSRVNVWLVINPYRPFAQDLDGITELVRHWEATSRLRFTGVISNPNLVEETDREIILGGHRQVLAFASKLNIPVGFLTVREDFYPELCPQFDDRLQSIKLYTRPEWLREETRGGI